MIRENLIGTLEELTGIETVGFAVSEDEAGSWLSNASNEWELAIVDMFLEQGNGLGVLQVVLNRPTHRKVVVLTNYATAEIRQRCLAGGADAVFDKSSELDALVDFCIANGGARH